MWTSHKCSFLFDNCSRCQSNCSLTFPAHSTASIQRGTLSHDYVGVASEHLGSHASWYRKPGLPDSDWWSHGPHQKNLLFGSIFGLSNCPLISLSAAPHRHHWSFLCSRCTWHRDLQWPKCGEYAAVSSQPRVGWAAYVPINIPEREAGRLLKSQRSWGNHSKQRPPNTTGLQQPT